jgi:hypothetical protein
LLSSAVRAGGDWGASGGDWGASGGDWGASGGDWGASGGDWGASGGDWGASECAVPRCRNTGVGTLMMEAANTSETSVNFCHSLFGFELGCFDFSSRVGSRNVLYKSGKNLPLHCRDNIKMHLREVGFGGVDWIHMA